MEDGMKLEVIVKTDDGKVICHQIVDEIENNASDVRMEKSMQIRQEIADRNSLQRGCKIVEKPKEKSYFSRLIKCCKLKNTNQEKSVRPALSRNSKESKVKSCCTEVICCCNSNLNECDFMRPSAKILVPKRTAILPTPRYNIPRKVPAHHIHSSGDSFTNRKATPRVSPRVSPRISPRISSGPEVVENKPVEKRIRPKTPTRCAEKGHWPIFDKRPLELMCKMTNCQNQTRVYCEKCDFHLCFNITRNCFYKFHKQNHHTLVDNSKQAAKPSYNTRKPEKPSNKIHTNRIGERIIRGDRNKIYSQRQGIPKDATKEKTKCRLGVRSLKVEKVDMKC